MFATFAPDKVISAIKLLLTAETQSVTEDQTTASSNLGEEEEAKSNPRQQRQHIQ